MCSVAVSAVVTTGSVTEMEDFQHCYSRATLRKPPFFALHNCERQLSSSRLLCPGQKSGHNTGSIPTTSPLLATLEIVVMSGRGRRSGDTLQGWRHQRQKILKRILICQDFVDPHATVLIFDYYTTQDAPLSASTLNDNEHQHKIQQKLCRATLESGFCFCFLWQKKIFCGGLSKLALSVSGFLGKRLHYLSSMWQRGLGLVWVLRSMPSTSSTSSTSSSPVFLIRLAPMSKIIFSIPLTTC